MVQVVSGQGPDRRRVSARLGFGIVVAPVIFCWWLLRPGYSKLARVLGFGWAAIAFLIIVADPMTPAPQAPAKPAAASATGGDASGTGNALNDALLAKAPAEQAKVLAAAVGDGCHGRRAFYDGIGHEGLADKQAFWSLACRDGRSFLIQLSPSDQDNKVLECATLATVAGMRCFTKF
jgi:hypothetical protein